MICLKLILDLRGFFLKFDFDFFSLALHLVNLHFVGLNVFQAFVTLGALSLVSDFGRFKIHTITELRLHMLEKRIVCDLNIFDLDRLDVNSPPR